MDGTGKGRRAIAALTGVMAGCSLALGLLPGIPPRPVAGLDEMSTGSVTAGIFASVAFPFKPGSANRWQEIERSAETLAAGGCADSDACRIRLGLIDDTVAAASGQPLVRRIAAVNTAVNRLLVYRSDQEAYGKLDYWALPAEILAAGKGDCEDYAILKMAALRRAGIPAGSMALVVLRDASRNAYHAILAVATTSGTYVLDNLRDAVLPDTALPQYQALYSLGSQRAWLHGYRRGSKFALQQRPASLEAVQPGEGVRDPS